MSASSSSPDTLPRLLERLDPDAPLPERHLWLMQLLDWLRGEGRTPEAAIGRLKLLLDALDVQPAQRERFRAWWAVLHDTVDCTALLADHGFSTRMSFMGELANRMRRKLLPSTPDTHDATELFHLMQLGTDDDAWLQALDTPTLMRLSDLLGNLPMRPLHWKELQSQAGPNRSAQWEGEGEGKASGGGEATACEAAPLAAPLTRWQDDVLQALTFCVSQIRAAGFSTDLRLRMDAATLQTRPFVHLASDMTALEQSAVLRGPLHPDTRAAGDRLRERLDECRTAINSIYVHLEENGISLNLVFVLRQVRERMVRAVNLIEALTSEQRHSATVRLLVRLVRTTHDGRSLRSLVNANLSMLAAKVTERSAETGSHYITRSLAEYRGMLRMAAGGGAVTALTTWLKFAVVALGLSAFWMGVWSGVVYAASFVAIQLLHFTLATKQPAMTAPTMAAKLKDLAGLGAIDAFVDEVTCLVRSQVAAVVGNVGLVVPCVVALSFGLQWLSGAPMIDRHKADAVFHNLHLLNPSTLLYAALTGILLFASSLIAGTAENAFVLHHLESALHHNPRLARWLGRERAQRLAHWLRGNVSALAGNVSLGLMLGIVPVLVSFFALPVDVRHVTLSAGQLAAAAAAYGPGVWSHAPFWWCVASIPLIGLLNISVSFYLALQLAQRAHNVSVTDRSRLRRAVLRRVLVAPLSFLLPSRTRPTPPP